MAAMAPRGGEAVSQTNQSKRPGARSHIQDTLGSFLNQSHLPFFRFQQDLHGSLGSGSLEIVDIADMIKKETDVRIVCG